MIESIKHKGLRLFFEKGDSAKINPKHAKRLRPYRAKSSVFRLMGYYIKMNGNQHILTKTQLTPVRKVCSEIKTPMLVAGESDIELQERTKRSGNIMKR